MLVSGEALVGLADQRGIMPGGIIPGGRPSGIPRPRSCLAPPILRIRFIMVWICWNCLISLLTSWTLVPDPAATRRLP